MYYSNILYLFTVIHCINYSENLQCVLVFVLAAAAAVVVFVLRLCTQKLSGLAFSVAQLDLK